MVLVIKLVYKFLREFDDIYIDTRSKNLFLAGPPSQVIPISIFYLFFVIKLGPSWMKNRPAYELKYVMMIYNLFQVLTNLTLLYMANSLFFANNKFSEWSCMLPDLSTTPYAIALKRVTHLFYLLKIIDYMDTVFFVLRKRQDQITFLHVYHHFGMVVGCYAILRYIGGGQTIILGYLNAYVHVIMYFYYFVSALRPPMNNSLWWKKYITQVQIVQFVLNIIHFSFAMLSRNCAQSKLLMLYGVLQNCFMMLMFADFYVKAYVRKPKLKKTL